LSKEIIIYTLLFVLGNMSGMSLAWFIIASQGMKLSNKKGGFIPPMPFKKFKAYHPSKDIKKQMERVEQEDMWG